MSVVPIGEASRRSGVGIETIRYYERRGVVPEPGRGPNGRRLYSPDDIARLRFIRRCRDLGFSLADARSLAEFCGGEAPCRQVQRVGRSHLDQIRAKRAGLDQMEKTLMRLMAACGQGDGGCSMLHLLAGLPEEDWPPQSKGL